MKIITDFIGHTRDEFISRTVKVGAMHEYGEIRNILINLKPLNPKIIFDIGANIGLHTINYAAHFPSATVYAFEPAKDNLEILHANIAKHNLANIIVVPCAVSDNQDPLTVYVNRSNSGDTRTIDPEGDYEPTDIYEVSTVTLDGFVEDNNLPKVAFIKMDTQGNELDVLTGGFETIIQDKPLIFMEFSTYRYLRIGADMGVFFDIAEGCEYRIYELGAGGIAKVDLDYIKHFVKRFEDLGGKFGEVNLLLSINPILI